MLPDKIKQIEETLVYCVYFDTMIDFNFAYLRINSLSPTFIVEPEQTEKQRQEMIKRKNNRLGMIDRKPTMLHYTKLPML